MEQFLAENPWILLLAILWMLPWTGVALWKAARNGHKGEETSSLLNASLALT